MKATMYRKSATQLSRLILNQLRPISTSSSSAVGTSNPAVVLRPLLPSPSHFLPAPRFLSSASYRERQWEGKFDDLFSQERSELLKEKEERIKQGLDTADLDARAAELDKREENQKKESAAAYEEPTDSDSDDEDERWGTDALRKRWDVFEKKFERHEQLLKNFTNAETLDEAHKWMSRIDKFEQKHFPLRSEYRVIGELMNRLKVAEGKEKFLLQLKINRALRMVQWKEACDPNDPANFGVIQREQAPSVDASERAELEEEQTTQVVENDSDDDLEFDDMKERDDILLEKLNAIDRKLETKLAELEHTFGRKGKLLEEEIRDLAEERNSLTEKKRKPLYRKGFDARLVDVNRTCKVTKGGQVVKYTALLACGNYNGVIGFAKAKGPAVAIALQKAYEKCFQNLHYIERHEEHTIAHAVQTNYKKTKVYLWPAPTQTGMKAGRTVQIILHLAGFKNVKSKVVGSRNPHNTVKAVFKALNAIETPKDVQEKFGRTVVESYLLQ
ncbi:uncharacterized protein LOC116011423 [Ipomoea triloba]|uniref:uncharacterized protein LOC116011423 n=1 Tax=Ipomoea triloba TaxID=35885 RepID=UPI00125E8611|nr:uncharacterized protein LOC116011423 [Ipomoea triloba]GLL23126.1 uncharacterized protein LOC109188435 isoform X1 [Ipomoea trifida]